MAGPGPAMTNQRVPRNSGAYWAGKRTAGVPPALNRKNGRDARDPPSGGPSKPHVQQGRATVASRRTRRGRPSSGSFAKPVLGRFEEGDALLARHRRKPGEKLVDGLPRLQIIEQRLHGHARAAKHRRTAHNVRAARNDIALHKDRSRPALPPAKKTLPVPPETKSKP